MTIRELMTGGLITVRPEASVRQARDLLSKEKIRHLLVTGPGRLTVAEIMTRSVITIGPDRPARDGAQLMLDRKIGALPVLDGHEAHVPGPASRWTDRLRGAVDARRS